MIFDQSSRRNAIKNILLAGVGVTAFPSFNLATAINYAASKKFYKQHEEQKLNLDPIPELQK